MVEKYCIQYHTDFHLLSALASIDDFENREIFLLGPKTKIALLIVERFNFGYFFCDTRGFKGNLLKIFTIASFKRNEAIEIVSPFVFPFFSLNYFFEKNIFPKKILRTDEGIGSYADIRHYYKSYFLEGRGKISSLVNAILKSLLLKITKLSGICREDYFFDKNGLMNLGKINNFKTIVKKLVCCEFENCVFFVSQPDVNKFFKDDILYVKFLKDVRKINFPNYKLIIQKHPRDSFDYEKYGFSVESGIPFELYSLKNCKIFGICSTALIMAKIIDPSREVFYIKSGIFGILFDGISFFCKKIFENNIKELKV